MRPRLTVYALALALGIVVLSPRPAEACHNGYRISRALFAVGSLTVNTPLVIHDLVVDRSSRGYGIAEALLTAPQIAIAASLISEGKSECEDVGGTLNEQSGGSGFTSVFLVMSAALFVHAVYVIVTPRTSGAATTKPKSQTAIGFAPLVVTDRGEVAGVTMGFTF